MQVVILSAAVFQAERRTSASTGPERQPDGAKDIHSARSTRLQTMKLQINGEDRDFNDQSIATLAVLIETLGMKPDRVAVELNRDIVPRDRWAQTALNEGDKLEVVHFVGGGSGACRYQELL